MSRNHLYFRVQNGFLKSAALAPTNAAALRDGQRVLSAINKNIVKAQDPLQGVSDEDLRVVVGYIVLKRENPILEKGDALNYEGAERVLDPGTFKDRSSLEEVLVNHANRLGVLSKPLDVDKGKVVVKEDK